MSSMGQTHLLSIDVEDWFQVDNLKNAIPRDSWSARELRVDRNINLILEILEKNATKATFFILGWIAEKTPDIVKKIHASGHEIATHGYGHDLVYNLNPERFRQDVGASKEILEDLIGKEVVGYRAPSFSITDWAIDELAELGFRYDSSLYPTEIHDRYGTLRTVKTDVNGPFKLRDGFFEIPLSCFSIFHQSIPWAGGGYFRVIPYALFSYGVRAILRQNSTYCFYIHPWEFDPEQPRVSNISIFYRYRHYNNLKKTEGRFIRLIQEFKFQPIRNCLLSL